MRVAVDVCIGRRGIKVLTDAGHQVVAVAQAAEPDRQWFKRAMAEGVEVVISGDSDLAVLCYDHRIRYIRAKDGVKGKEMALRAVLKMQAWIASGALARAIPR